MNRSERLVRRQSAAKKFSHLQQLDISTLQQMMDLTLCIVVLDSPQNLDKNRVKSRKRTNKQTNKHTQHTHNTHTQHTHTHTQHTTHTIHPLPYLLLQRTALALQRALPGVARRRRPGMRQLRLALHASHLVVCPLAARLVAVLCQQVLLLLVDSLQVLFELVLLLFRALEERLTGFVRQGGYSCLFCFLVSRCPSSSSKLSFYRNSIFKNSTKRKTTDHHIVTHLFGVNLFLQLLLSQHSSVADFLQFCDLLCLLFVLFFGFLNVLLGFLEQFAALVGRREKKIK